MKKQKTKIQHPGSEPVELGSNNRPALFVHIQKLVQKRTKIVTQSRFSADCYGRGWLSRIVS
jgi:hypothetical protein